MLEEILKKLVKEVLADEGLSVSKSLANKKNMPKRLKDPHKLEEENPIEDEPTVEETTSLGVGLNKKHSAGHKERKDEIGRAHV